ncbi:MAG: short-chain fatty acyl-CoA regulator family protein [Caulobacteraceae bacterium]|nr:short-chain fatty acyl-CoA regulator family protein [Caulobacteraceae bacterium]
MSNKLFVGPKVRHLREARAWTLETCAAQLGLSISYLSQIETNLRPVTARVLISLIRVFEVDASTFDADDDERLIADLREATAEQTEDDSPSLAEIKQVVSGAPGFARQYLRLHRAYRRLDERLKTTEEAVALDEATAASAVLPYEEVRDYFHYRNNYVHELDLAAEALAEACGLGQGASPLPALESFLWERCGMRAQTVPSGSGVLRHYDPASRILTLDATQPTSTRVFQLAFQIVSHQLRDLIEAELAQAGFRTAAAADVCRIGLGNYAAGALVMPYLRFRQAAQDLGHDIEQLQAVFHTSFEQVCHRLSTLQRPAHRGLPFYFVRVDLAGNITKRHSATRLQFARFGGGCPLWNVHEAFGQPGRIMVQLAEMPDGVRYLCVARGITKRSGSYLQPERRYAVGLGCEISHAHQVVYSRGLDLTGPAAQIGVSCRICERDNCPQRAFPPIDRPLRVPANERAIVPYVLEEPRRPG